MQTIAGLNSIRFLCAFWVAMGHLGPPPLTAWVDKSTTIGWLVRGFYGNLVSGPAAVIVFFVISGLCIHFPFAASGRIASLPEYFARRYIRIGIPMAVAMFVADRLKLNMGVFNASILWSLVAEIVYYTIYPALLRLRRCGMTWTTMIGVTFVAAFAIPALFPFGRNYPSPGDYPAFGVELNWLLGLPCWLLGCRLAEALRTQPAIDVGRLQIWSWRMSVWGASLLCSVLRFHSPLGYPWTLNVFAVLVALWLAREASYFSRVPPPALLERAGGWSYSLYLTHGIAAILFGMLPMLPMLRTGVLVYWSAKMSFALLVAAAFGFCFEAPSHRLARKAGTWARNRLAMSVSERSSA